MYWSQAVGWWLGTSLDVLVACSRLVTGNTTGCIGHRQSVGDWEHHWMYWEEAVGWWLGTLLPLVLALWEHVGLSLQALTTGSNSLGLPLTTSWRNIKSSTQLYSNHYKVIIFKTACSANEHSYTQKCVNAKNMFSNKRKYSILECLL